MAASADDGVTDERAEREEVERLRAELRDLRARARVYPLVSQAQGMLRERYRLADAESAFALLQRASQRFNIRMRTLVDAVVTTPGPERPEAMWFPRRVRSPEPGLRLSAARDAGERNRGGVLGAVLSQTLAVVGTDMGNVQLADRVHGGLRIEKHTGLTPDFVDFFGYVGDRGTSCAKAAQDVTQVTVHDVGTDPVFTEPAREAILTAGSRACHSVPLTTASGLCLGMVSAHVDRPLGELTPAQLKVLDALGAETGRWLAWHEHTVVLDALEHLHALGRAARGSRLRRS
ncbi:ANTAR domain-containing protein [Streptomyces viridiviolaceus]